MPTDQNTERSAARAKYQKKRRLNAMPNEVTSKRSADRAKYETKCRLNAMPTEVTNERSASRAKYQKKCRLNAMPTEVTSKRSADRAKYETKCRPKYQSNGMATLPKKKTNNNFFHSGIFFRAAAIIPSPNIYGKEKIMEKKFSFADQPKRVKIIYCAAIAILCMTAIIIGIVGAASQKDELPPSGNQPPVSDNGGTTEARLLPYPR